MVKKLFIFSFIHLWLLSPILMATEVTVPENQMKLEINGAVCAYCAYGLQKSFSKMDGVDKSQGHKGVEADIENQIITIYLKEGSRLDLYKSIKNVEKSGYEPRLFRLRHSGSINKEGSDTFLVGANQEKLLKLEGDLVAQLEHQKVYDLQVSVGEETLESLEPSTLVTAVVDKIV